MAQTDTPWTLALDLRLIATLREHLRCDEWRSDEHGDIPWKCIFARAVWPEQWTTSELAKRWTHTYRRWLPAPLGSVGRAQVVNFTSLEAVVCRHYAQLDKKRAAPEASTEEVRVVRQKSPSPAALLSPSQEQHVRRWLPLLMDARRQGQCHLRVGGVHELELDWLLHLLSDAETGDVQVQDLEARFLKLASILVPKARFTLAPQCTGLRVRSNGAEFAVDIAAGNVAALQLPAVSSLKQLLQVGLFLALRPPVSTPQAWPSGLTSLLWWHLLSQPNVCLALPPPALPLPYTSLLQVLESLGLNIQRSWVAQTLATLPLSATMECLADTFAGQQQFLLLSLCDAPSRIVCQWRDRSKPLTIIAEGAQQHFAVVLTLEDVGKVITVTSPSPQSITRFHVDDTACELIESPQQLPALLRCLEFRLDSRTVCIETAPTPVVPAAALVGGASSSPTTAPEPDEKLHRKRARELLEQPESKPKEKLLRELWTSACAPDSNLGVAEVGPSPQKQTFVRPAYPPSSRV